MTSLDPRTIARALGGDVTGRDSINVPGPGHGPKDRSLAIKLNGRAPGGFVVFSHSGDNPIECRDYVREKLRLEPWEQGGDRDRAPPRRHRTPFSVTDAGPDPDQERRRLAALRIWASSVDPRGTIVERYLSEHRGLVLTHDLAGGVIRFHSSLYVDSETCLPGMVCLLRDIFSDDPVGIHRTFLDRDTAAKIDRKMLGIAKGTAIKLDPQASVATTLTIGEGVETVLSARMTGFTPAWALGSSGAVKAFPVLAQLAEISILEENDATSRRDVKVCAKRYLGMRKPVNIVTSKVGNDLNDARKASQR